MAPYVTTDVTSKFVFAGYGFTDSTTGYNDFKDVELKDKIVLIHDRKPSQ